jgi:hypothetical protein
LCREDGCEALQWMQALRQFDVASCAALVDLRELLAQSRIAQYRRSDLRDHEVLTLVRRAIRDGDLLVVHPGNATNEAPSEVLVLRRLVAQIDRQMRGTLSTQGRRYKLVVGDDLANVPSPDHFEVVSQADAHAVLGQIAREASAHVDLFKQAKEKISKDWRPPFSYPDGLVLLRRLPIRASLPRDVGPAIAPSQMKALLDKAKLDIHVVDLAGIPQEGLSYRIEMPDGGLAQGNLDKDGRASAKSSAPGVFTVRFPDLDGADWDGDGALELPPEEERSEAGKHEVKQGERLPTIARAEGFARWQTVWEFAANAALRESGGNAHILLPGAHVAIPSKLKRVAEVQGGEAEYVVQAAPEVLRLRFAESEAIDGTVLFRATPDAGDEMFEGELADDGTMEVPLPPDTKQVTVQLYCGDSDDAFVTYEFAVGEVDPVTESTGIQARLASLGYYDGDIHGTLDDATKGAIVRFRREYGLPLSDAIDDDLRNALTWVCDDDDDTGECEADHTALDDASADDSTDEAEPTQEEMSAVDSDEVDDSEESAETGDEADSDADDEEYEEDWPEPDDEDLNEWSKEDWGEIGDVDEDDEADADDDSDEVTA